MRLHTLGDSHAEAAWIKIKPEDTPFEDILINSIGPFTMARFGTEKLRVLDIASFWIRSFPPPLHNHYFNIENGDAVVFCFGEIDCRAHLLLPEYWPDYWNNDKTFESLEHQEIIDVLVDRYFDAIKMNVEKFEFLHTMVFNIVPTPKTETIPYNKTFPLIGPDRQRKMIAEYMNKKIKEYCERNHFIFFDVYDKYCDGDGYLNNSLASHVHVDNPIYYVEFLNNLKL